MAFKYPTYTEEQHETWRLLYKKQMELLPNRACDEFLEGLKHLKLESKKIPALADLDKALTEATGWRVERVEGLVPEKEFFQFLSQKKFPSTDFIRERTDLNYTPAPDMFHDIFGHMPMITHPDFASFFQLMGAAGVKAEGETLKEVQRFYWFTVEFGLIRKGANKRIYGSGILSSPGEVVYCLEDDVEVHEFNVPKIIKQEYDIWHMQGELFVIESFDQLKNAFRDFGRDRNLLP
jgi:phenylalanine-4-hydroxylase